MRSSIGESEPLIAHSVNHQEVLPGAKEPLLKNIRWRLLMRMSVVFLGCALASGPLSAFPTIQPLLQDAKVFYKGDSKLEQDEQLAQLSTLYTIAMGLSVGLFFLQGYLYDRFGARIAATGGALGVTVGLVLIWLGTLSHDLNWLLYIGFPLADGMGLFNSFALFGFLWHYARTQALIIGLGNASYQVSAIMGFVLVAMVNAGLSVAWGFLAFAVLAVIAAAISFVATPSPKEFYDSAEAYFGFRIPHQPSSPLQSYSEAFDVMRQKPLECIFYGLSAVTAYCFLLYWFAYLYPYLSTLFPANTAKEVADAVSLAYTICGMFLTPALGGIMDAVGFVRFYFVLCLLLAAGTITMFFASIPLQLVSIFCCVVYICAWINFLAKFAALFAPPDLIGSFFGTFFSLAGITQLVINLTVPPVLASKYGESSTEQFTVMLGVLGAVANLLGIGMFIVLWRRGVPDIPPTPRNRK